MIGCLSASQKRRRLACLDGLATRTPTEWKKSAWSPPRRHSALQVVKSRTLQAAAVLLTLLLTRACVQPSSMWCGHVAVMVLQGADGQTYGSISPLFDFLLVRCIDAPQHHLQNLFGQVRESHSFDGVLATGHDSVTLKLRDWSRQ